jgi:hypothetical protein
MRYPPDDAADQPGRRRRGQHSAPEPGTAPAGGESSVFVPGYDTQRAGQHRHPSARDGQTAANWYGSAAGGAAGKGPVRGYPPLPGQPPPMYPPGQFSAWNRGRGRARSAGPAADSAGDGWQAGGAREPGPSSYYGADGEPEAEPGYSALAVSDPAADVTSTQTWQALGDGRATGTWTVPARARPPYSADGDGAAGGPPAARGVPGSRPPESAPSAGSAAIAARLAGAASQAPPDGAGPLPGRRLAPWSPQAAAVRASGPHALLRGPGQPPGGPDELTAEPGPRPGDPHRQPGTERAPSGPHRQPGTERAPSGPHRQPGTERAPSGPHRQPGTDGLPGTERAPSGPHRQPGDPAQPGRGRRRRAGGPAAPVEPAARPAGRRASGRDLAARASAPPGRAEEDGTAPATGRPGARSGQRPQVRRKHPASVKLAIACSLLLVIAASSAIYYVATRTSPSASRTADRPQTTPSVTAAPTPTFAGPYGHIASRAADPAPLTIAELFPASFSAQGFSVTRTASRLSSDCIDAVSGANIQSAVSSGGCSQVARATYIAAAKGMMGTIGVLNLRTATQALRAAHAAGASNFISQLAGRKPPTSKIGKGTGLGEAVAKGHYLILVWAEFTSLRRPRNAAQTAELDQFMSDLWQDTANVSLSNRMVNGTPS